MNNLDFWWMIRDERPINSSISNHNLTEKEVVDWLLRIDDTFSLSDKYDIVNGHNSVYTNHNEKIIITTNDKRGSVVCVIKNKLNKNYKSMSDNIIVEGVVNLCDLEKTYEGTLFEAPLGDEEPIHLKLCSHDENGEHSELLSLLGKKLKVTIEVIEEGNE